MTKKRRKRKADEDEPLFDQNDQAASKPQSCVYVNCKMPVLDPTTNYCALHALISGGQQRLKKTGQKASRRGDYAVSTLAHIGTVLLDYLAPAVSVAAEKVSEDPIGSARVAAGAFKSFAPKPPPPEKQDPFAVLGLDRKTATADDVRKMQKKLARIYHPDIGNNDAAATKLKELNAAAAACLSLLPSP